MKWVEIVSLLVATGVRQGIKLRAGGLCPTVELKTTTTKPLEKIRKEELFQTSRDVWRESSGAPIRGIKSSI